MLTSLTNKDGLTLRSAYKDAIKAALRSADFTTLKHEFSKLLNELSYESTAMFTEAGFRNIYKIMLQILGFYVWTEYQTAMGRCDLCFEGQGRLYVIELKIAPDRSKVPECLQQAWKNPIDRVRKILLFVINNSAYCVHPYFCP